MNTWKEVLCWQGIRRHVLTKSFDNQIVTYGNYCSKHIAHQDKCAKNITVAKVLMCWRIITCYSLPESLFTENICSILDYTNKMELMNTTLWLTQVCEAILHLIIARIPPVLLCLEWQNSCPARKAETPQFLALRCLASGVWTPLCKGREAKELREEPPRGMGSRLLERVMRRGLVQRGAEILQPGERQVVLQPHVA